MAQNFKNFIGGAWQESSSGRTFENRNPARPSELIGLFPRSSAPDVDAAVESAARGFEQWRRTPAPERGDVLRRVGDLMTGPHGAPAALTLPAEVQPASPPAK